MSKQEKMSSKERQALITRLLKETTKPITGNEFSQKTNVSRQVIVQDISLLKAKGKPIVATSQGYIYLNKVEENKAHKKVIVCNHPPERTAEELHLITDHGVSLKNVIVEHPVYGDITATIHVSNRKEANQFVKKIEDASASYLSVLTNGVHLHTLEADTEDKLEAVCNDLETAGILVSR